MSQFAVWTPSVPSQRQVPAAPRGERQNLVEYLDYYRGALERKCQGLTAEQMGTRAVPPSAISLLGLVRHLSRVEHHWFRRILGNEPTLPRLFSGEGDDAGFEFGHEVNQALVDSAWALWRFEVHHSRDLLRRVEMSDLVRVDGQLNEVRDVVMHMIEEYARHLGHADLIRECIDGRTGH
ncbi:MAG: DinB family protein [Nocardioides sp.]|uniref:DinB family protein n=1 Tax=Nocardioides sp. TaxID=35761 RepID=UPI003F08A162